MRIYTPLSIVILILISACFLGPFAFEAYAQEESGAIDRPLDEQEIAAELSNPVGNLWNIVFQNNLTFLDGDISDKTRIRWLTNFQPVMPVPLTRKWNVILRPILPFVSAPVPLANGNFDRQTGLGDLTVQTIFSPNKSGITWGVGPVLGFPTATSKGLGSDKYTAGPLALGFYTSPSFVAGLIFFHLWDYAGKSSRQDVDVSTLQYVAVYVTPSAWTFGVGTPIITANWEADDDDRWTVPVGPSVGKLFNVGIPLQISLEGSYSVVSPDTYGEEWNIRLIVKPVIPGLIQNPIFGN